MLKPTSFDNTQFRFATLARVTTPACTVLLVCLLMMGQSATILAQQPQDPQAGQLREQIAALESVEREAAATPEISLSNRRFLGERRALLRGILQKQIEGWRRYLSVAGPHLNGQEREGIEKTVRGLEAELLRIEGEIRGETAGEVANTETSAHIPASHTPADDGAAAAPRPALIRAALSPAAAGAEPPLAAPPQSAPPSSTCYPNPLPGLADAVRNAADRIVTRNDPMQIRPAFFSILLMSMADAVFEDAPTERAAHADLIDGIRFFRAQSETKRTDKQIGASARAEGSTSAVEKPGFAELLGFAIEHGAVQKETNGTTFTLSTSPYVLFYHGQDDTSTVYKNYGYLSRVGVSATFNIADQNNLLASATRNQLDEWSVRARLSGDRSYRSYPAEQMWDKFRGSFAKPDIVFTAEMAREFQSDAGLESLRRQIAGEFTTLDFQKSIKDVLDDASITDPNVKTDRIYELILCRVRTAIFNQVRSGAFRIDSATREHLLNKVLPNLKTALDARAKAVKDFQEALDALSYRPEFTLAYNNKRQAAASDYSTLKLLFQKKSHEGMNIIGNAGFSLYHKPDAALHQQRLRDFAAALSFEGIGGRSPFLSEGGDESRVTFSFTGRYQRMFENRNLPNRKADIAVAQFKFVLPILAGISLPFSVTYANATELIKESHVRTNFGFTVDTDKILQIINLGKSSKVQ